MTRSYNLDLSGDPASEDPAQRKSLGTVSRLLRDIAACREEILRREAFAAELEARLRRELEPLEQKLVKIRLETFRILVGHVRAGRLGKRARESLVDVLCEFADELTDLGCDVEEEMRGILPQDGFDELESMVSSLFERLEGVGKADPAGGADAAGSSFGDSGHGWDFGNGRGSGHGGDPGQPEGWSDGPRRQRRGRKPKGAKSKAALKREAEETALAGDIRALYLLLARALHPDKESDAARVAEKTAWMQQVTAAYQARDLGRLLDILARNPLDAVGPYLNQAPAKTVQGFAKRLRRELEALRAKSLRVGGHFHPVFARFVQLGRVEEAEYRRFQGALKKQVAFHRQRREAYRDPDQVMEMIRLLKQFDWRDLM